MLSLALRQQPDLKVEYVQNYGEIADLQPDAVFALGPDSLAVLQEMGVVPKNRKIGSMRARVLTLPNDIPVMVSYSPGIKEVDYGMFITLLTDTGTVARLAATGSIEPKLGEYRYVEHFQEIQQRIIALYCKTQQPVPVALDLETVGLDEYALPDPATGHPGAYIVSIQVTCEPGKSDVVYFDNAKHEQDRLTNFEFAQRLSWLLSSPMISLRGANLKYDLRWLAKRGDFTCTNFKLDTTLVGSLLDENRINGLDVHTKIYVPSLGGYSDVFDQTTDKARMDLVPREKLLPYAGGDTDADWQVADKMKVELLEDPALAKFYVNILHPAARAFELVERGGIFIDPEKFRALEADLETEALKIVHKAKQIVGGRLVAKHQDEEKAGGLNITKASFINDYMFSPMGLDLKPMDFTPKLKKDGSKNPSTSLDSLMKFKDIPEASEFIKLMGEYGSLTKTLGTYVRGFMKCVRSDGKFHPNYWFFVGDRDEGEGGADTGRLSVKNPAVQTIPKHTKWTKRLRECYIAPPGYVIVERDYEQGELKVIACLANETNMIDAYRKGMDLHVMTSAKVAGYTYDEMIAMKNSADAALVFLYEETRQKGKAGNFGKIYGMGVGGFIEYARINYGVDLTHMESEEFDQAFFTLYPLLKDYHAQQKREARKYKQVRGPLGRIRHLPLIDSPLQNVRAQAERQAINSPTQGTLSDMMIWTFSECQLALPQYFEQQIIVPCLAVHDAGYDYIREDKYEECTKLQLDIMQNLPFNKVGWNPQLQFTADAKYGYNLADMKKLKL